MDTAEKKGSVFASVNEVAAAGEPEMQAQMQTRNEYIETEGVFAEGLPAWSVEPPQVVVRRKK